MAEDPAVTKPASSLAMSSDRGSRARENPIKVFLGGVLAVVVSPYRFVRWLAEWLTWWGAKRRRMGTLAFLLLVGAGSGYSALDMRGTCTDVVAVSPDDSVSSDDFARCLVVRADSQDKRWLKCWRSCSGLSQLRLNSTETVEAYYLPPPEVLKPMALGHEGFLADVLVARSLQYFTSHLVADRKYDWFDQYINAILALDPYNRRVYTWAAQNVMLHSEILPEHVESAHGYLRKGLEVFPDYWHFYFSLGLSYMQDVAAETREQRMANRKKATHYIHIASMLPDQQVPPNFVRTMLAGTEQRAQAIASIYARHWGMVGDDFEQSMLSLAQLESMTASERLRARHRRWRDDYVCLGSNPLLFQLLGPEATPVLALNRAVENEQ